MAKKGGYLLIDLKRESLTLDTKKIMNGVYTLLNNNKSKRVVITGLCVRGVRFVDVTVDAVKDVDKYIFYAYNYKFTVTDDNGITATQYERPGLATKTKAGIVKQAQFSETRTYEEPPPDIEGAGIGIQQLAQDINNLATVLKNAGIMASS